MPETLQVKGFWSYCRAVILRPLWTLITEGVLFVLLAWLTWIRDNLTLEETQRRYATLRFIPNWRWQSWIILFLAVELALLLRNSYKLFHHERQEANRLREGIRGPELLIEYQDHEDIHKVTGSHLFSHPIRIRNLSRDKNAYNVCIKDLVTPAGRAEFQPKIVPCVAAGSVESFSPRVADASPICLENLALLFAKSYKDISTDELMGVKSYYLTVEYDDEQNHRFRAECELLYRHWKQVISTGQIKRTLM